MPHVQTQNNATLMQKTFASSTQGQGRLTLNRPVYQCNLQPVSVNGSTKRARRGAFAWGEDKCGELGKQEGRDTFRVGWRLFMELFYADAYKGALEQVTHTNKCYCNQVRKEGRRPGSYTHKHLFFM